MDNNRRKFLKIMFVGSGAILMEKILGPLYSRFIDNSPAKSNSLNQANFKNFRVVEGKKKLSIYDSTGEEIFKIDNSKV